jgi:hypothetical protein
LGQNSAAAAAYTTAIHLAQGVADSERASGAGAEREPGAEVEAMLVTLHYALGTVYQRLEVGERPVGDGGEEGGRGDGAARQGACGGAAQASCAAKAAASFRAVLARDPAHALAAHAVAAYDADPATSRASKAYVERLFDDYAPTFEASLAGLSYRAPELLAAAIAQVLAEGGGGDGGKAGGEAGGREFGAHQRLPQRLPLVLDAGCGTGLLGPLLAGFVAPGGALLGLDLSPQMAAIAVNLVNF